MCIEILLGHHIGGQLIGRHTRVDIAAVVGDIALGAAIGIPCGYVYIELPAVPVGIVQAYNVIVVDAGCRVKGIVGQNTRVKLRGYTKINAVGVL